MPMNGQHPDKHTHDGEVLLRCRDLEVGWNHHALLPPINLEIRRRCLLVVVGRNGSGKSTWLKTLLGLAPAIAGRVERSRSDLRLAYVPQSNSLDTLMPLSVRDVVAQARLNGASFWRPTSSPRDRHVCHQALIDAEAADLADAAFNELSKGQRQRVLFARMLATEADVAFLDEPTAAMDLMAERRAIERLAEISHNRNMAIVVISHAIGLATASSDHILLLNRAEKQVLFGERQEVLADELYCAHYHASDPTEHDPPHVD